MDGLKNWIQSKDPKTFAFGFLLLLCSAIAIIGLLTKGYTSYYLTGSILFAFLGIAMIRKSKRF
jgi:putative effector of murein hydrolase